MAGAEFVMEADGKQFGLARKLFSRTYNLF